MAECADISKRAARWQAWSVVSTFQAFACKFRYMRAAFKEWAVVVDALGRGDQIIILRKGGISEGRSGFQMEHQQFLLFPTLFHQQRESVIASAQARYDAIAPNFPPKDRLRLEYFAEVAQVKQLNSQAEVNALHGQHIWREEVIAERFDWGKTKSIYALVVRVYRLPQVVELPMLSAYDGCKSWIQVDHEVHTDGAKPVLDEIIFDARLRRFRNSIAESVVGATS